jgi:metallo-beta-lactamase class B
MAMPLYSLKKTALLLLLSCLSLFSLAQKVAEPPNLSKDWSRPYQPFQIVGNLYYVGTYDLACYLIVTPKGNILINTGLAGSAPMIKANIESLGFKITDIKILLTTQAHYDHVGTMAEIKNMTGAKMMVDEQDAEVCLDGGKSDYAYGGEVSTFAPFKPDALLKDGAVIKLGGMKLTMLHHPGHTKGSCSFVFDVKDKEKAWKVLIVNMPTIVIDKNFSEVPSYPNISADYAYTLASMKKQTFDIWLSSHANQFNMNGKHKPGDAYNPSAFIDRKGYDAAVERYDKEYQKKITQNNMK